jgi:hypothetical protein
VTLDNSDIELITQIAKNIPPWGSFFSAIIGGFVTGGFAILSVRSSQKHDALMKERKRKIDELQQKKQIRSRLLGSEFFVTNIYYAHSNSYINYKYHQTMTNYILPPLKETAPEKPHENKYFRQITKDEFSQEVLKAQKLAERESEYLNKYASDWGIASRELWEIIGLIQVTFDNTNNMRDKLIDELDKILANYKNITSDPSESEIKDMHKIEKWRKDKIENEIPNYFENEVTPAFKKLLDYLLSEINKNTTALEESDVIIKPRCYRICKFFCNP